jgi:hypothetical protein
MSGFSDYDPNFCDLNETSFCNIKIIFTNDEVMFETTSWEMAEEMKKQLFLTPTTWKSFEIYPSKKKTNKLN